MIDNILGLKLRNLREKKHITQKELAKQLGVSDRSVGYYESGQRVPPPDILNKIANYYGASVDYLLGRTDKKSVIKVDTKEKANQVADKIIQIFIDTGEITREELDSGEFDDEKIEKLLIKVKKTIIFNQEMDQILKATS